MGVSCSACEVVSIILFSENKFSVRTGRLHGGSGLPTVWERFLTGFMWWLEYELHVCLAQQGCVLYIYM